MFIQSIQSMYLLQSLTLLEKINNNQIVLRYMTQSCMNTWTLMNTILYSSVIFVFLPTDEIKTLNSKKRSLNA